MDPNTFYDFLSDLLSSALGMPRGQNDLLCDLAFFFMDKEFDDP